MTSSKQAIWQVYAPIYDSLLLLKPYTSYLQECANLINVKDGELLLDVGCGTGNLLLVISRGHVFETDRSTLMLFFAKAKYVILKRLKPTLLTATFFRANASQVIPIHNNCVDHIVSLSTIHSFPNPECSVIDMVRVLKPGGRILLTIPLPTTTGSIIKEHICTASILRLFLSIIGLPLLLMVLLINVIQEKWNKEGVFKFMTKEQVQKIAEQSGLKILEIRECFSGTYTLLMGQKI